VSITLYYGSGSPFAWRVWLALEHKGLPYELKTLSFSAGDHKKPEFLALNPRHKVPVLTDGDFTLYESAAICEYLEDAYPTTGARKALWPADAKRRAIARRLTREADTYIAPAVNAFARQIFFFPPDKQNVAEIEKGRDDLIIEMDFFENAIAGDFLAGPLSLADFTLYPFLALAQRAELKRPSLAIGAAYGPKLEAWKARVEALPYFEKTIPPHWKAS
jgi:glutathione S-transferase